MSGPTLREEGQMVVELAVVAPLMIVIALIVFNLMVFLEASSRFDRVAPDAVLAMGVSPAGDGAGSANVARLVKEAIEHAMAGLWGVEVSVDLEGVWDGGSADGVGFSFAPHLTRFMCTLRYRPWPGGASIAGFDAAIPLELVHRCSVVVDRYRTGVVF